MKRFISTLCAASIAVSLVGASALSASAAPIAVSPSIPDGQVINVQAGDWQRRMKRREMRQDRREFRRESRQDRREFRRESRQDKREFRREARQDRRDHRRLQRRGDNYYYRGHRGYRHSRPGYREIDGWWFPAAAFVAGAIVSGAVSNPPVVVQGGNAHVQWCYDRYRSYRASDNTFQPYNGPRKQCYSPYS